MIRFETLLEKVRAYSPESDLELLRRAYVFSALEHKGQVRHSGDPYLVHPLEVADFLADMRLDVVAEGIELPEQIDSLRDLGCDLGQGFLFAKPMNQEALIDYLDAGEEAVGEPRPHAA